MLRRTILTGAASLILMAAPFVTAGNAMNKMQLHSAAGKNDAALVSRLLAEGAEIDTRDSRGATALLVATHANAIDAARVLIDAGADVNAKDDINDSPYLYAGARGHLEILKMTLAHGADLKSTNRYGGTALIPASERGHVETVKTLIEAGSDINHVNNLHWTALLEAIILGDDGSRHQQIVELLVKAGADVNLADGEGVTPLQHARRSGYRDIEQILVAAGGR
ncbi:ankyrin repeat domain-containing protein [Paracoccus onubensis]|uniref:ankyrin repeat domain-containing protein n=1 Tax=Paracoccus onubensis TaxID=1675788 RepID=UPI00272F2B4D|nr:ankyrin repeat domain-containing protein [Paracoccus onubensis]MDP0929925.1 ankyrin repeat domain-containing protein [Paracoccus onubensis]